ncbi:MAG: hypothetical protein HN919_16320 [Verrucomicrobia bacterium]|jgi:hypothetical protein|nr:hypothetical protein [Verrucomicrobiota bacterium]
MPILFIVGVVALIGFSMYFSWLSAKRRREGIGVVAAQLGLRFNPEKQYDLAKRYGFMNALRKGSKRYAFNVIEGAHEGHQVEVFDYHYETHSTDSKGRRQTHHHYFSFFVLTLPAAFPELTIAREGIFSKIAQALGHDDIDFESHEFSRRFCVRSKDKKFAYDFCNAQMIEYLMTSDGFSIEVEGASLAMAFTKRLDPSALAHNLGRLIRLRSLMPDYLFEGA